MTTEISTQENPFELRTYADVERFASLAAKSDFVPKDYRDKPGNIMIAIQYGHELGIKPLQALQGIAVINGRPILWGDAFLALIMCQRDFGGINEGTTGSVANGNAIGFCEITRAGKTTRIEFTLQQASKAGLIGKSGPWTTHPERMLMLKARGFCGRDTYADVLKGMRSDVDTYDDVEFEDITNKTDAPKLGTGAVIKVMQGGTPFTPSPIPTNNTYEKPQETISNVDPITGEVMDETPAPAKKTTHDGAPSFSSVKKQMESAKDINELIHARDVSKACGLTKLELDEIKLIFVKKQGELKG